MKKILCFLIVLLMSIMMSGIGGAAIVQWDVGIDGFHDTDTDLYWIDPYFFTTHDYEDWLMSNDGWELATHEQLSSLIANIPDANSSDFWNTFLVAIGQSTYSYSVGPSGGSHSYWEGYMLEDALNNDAFRYSLSISPGVMGGGGTSWGFFDSTAVDFIGDPGAWVVSVEQAPVPEPATIFLLGSGLVGLARFSRKKFKK